LSSGSYKDLTKLLLEIKRNATAQSNDNKFRRNLAMFVVAPVVFESELDLDYDDSDECKAAYFQPKERPLVTFQRQNSFRVHFSGEHLSRQIDLVNCNYDGFRDTVLRECLVCRCNKWSFVQRVLNAFALNFYQVIV
jgi:hypothetical protein